MPYGERFGRGYLKRILLHEPRGTVGVGGANQVPLSRAGRSPRKNAAFEKQLDGGAPNELAQQDGFQASEGPLLLGIVDRA